MSSNSFPFVALCGMDRDGEGVSYALGMALCGTDFEHVACVSCATVLDEDAIVTGVHAGLFNQPKPVVVPAITLRSLGL